MLEEEAVEVVKQFDLLADYREAVLFVLNYVQTNKHLLCCAYDSMGREEMKRFFCADFIGITQSVICDTERQMGIHAEEQFKEFLSHFYTEAIAGLLIGEFTNKEAHDPEQVVEYLSRVLKNSLPSLLASAIVRNASYFAKKPSQAHRLRRFFIGGRSGAISRTRSRH